MARDSSIARAIFRTKEGRSGDDRDLARRLQRALRRAGQRSGRPQAVQVAGQPLDAEDYGRWRERKLRRDPTSAVPELQPGHYALVLVAIDPSTTGQFLHRDAGRHLTPPTVREFEQATKSATALARMLISWLEQFPRSVALAPPLLYTHGRWRVAELGLDWPLAPYTREPH